ncbi:adenylyl-sulfate kinase [Trinickia fusca]|uniref:Adenylyl-sulfate kinase n=1 Tax=Trinickia fusca TaxID=2419777 RepID=A0A494X569_9BURK|nr:adenylyl-sulfate kinase [Trinickia fusca]RKP45482.1 adenylyl-sulfate kinase [Trinickia fusca]
MVMHRGTPGRPVRKAVKETASVDDDDGDDAPANVFRHAGGTACDARARQFGYAALTIWLTGLSGAGKSTIAYELEQLLTREKRPCAVLDGDNLRYRLNRDLGFTARDRHENVRRTAEVARLMNDAGLIVIASLVSPYRIDRATARGIIGASRFAEVYVSTALEVCEARDPKGLYRKARRGEISHFTGISSPYERPVEPSLVLDTGSLPCGAAAAMLHAYLTQRCEAAMGPTGEARRSAQNEENRP